MSPGRWKRRAVLLALAASLAAAAAGPARAAYQATADSNTTAFSFNCIRINDTFPAKLLAAAVAGYRNLGYSTTGFSGVAFTQAHVLARTPADWGYYVHSHGDYYWHAGDARRYTGFREDSGDCSQAVIFSKDIKAKRLGRQSNLVFVSTCHAADSNTTLPDAFAIAKTKSTGGVNQGPEFFVGYIGVQWDTDEWIFEQRFWNTLAAGKGVGVAFDVAMLGSFGHSGFDADWWGTYHWSGVAGPWTTCANCS